MFGKLSTKELAGLYKAVGLNGCYIHPHRAEALGLPILEAIACGCRVGTTGWGGPKYTTQGIDTVKLFNYKLEPSTFHNNKEEPFYKKNENPCWAELDKRIVKMWMSEITKQSYNEAKLRTSSERIIGKYSYKNIAKNIFNILQKIHGDKLKDLQH